MESTRSKSLKKEQESSLISSFIRKADNFDFASHLLEIKEVRWQSGNSFATISADKEGLQLPIHAIYQAFGKKEAQLRRIVDLLMSGDAQQVKAEIALGESEENDQLVIRVEAIVEHLEEGERLIVINFLSDTASRTSVSDLFKTHIAAGLLIVEAHSGAIEEANSEALALLNITEDELEGVAWQRTPEWAQFVREVTEQDKVTNRILEVVPDKVWLLFSAQYIQGKIYAVAQNVTSIQQQIHQLEKVNVGLDNFVYHASHDLRAPLRSMQGLLTLLRKETSNLERDKFVNLIEGSIMRLDAFLVDLLSISRSRRSAKRPLLKINFMVEVEKAVSSFFHLEDHKNLEISTRISQTQPFISDLTQVRVILNNIISNAFKYRRYGVRKSRIKVEILVSKKQVKIKVADNGVGMEPEHLPHVFEMFYRATDRNDGSGLGLYIVRETIEKLNGKISITSRPNRGTTFTVNLPNQHPTQPKD